MKKNIFLTFIVLLSIYFMHPMLASHVDLSHNDYSGIIFDELHSVGVNFTESRLVGAAFYNGNLVGANFTSANLTNARFDETNLADVIFTEANLTGAHIYGDDVSDDERLELGHAYFDSAIITNARFKCLDLSLVSGIHQIMNARGAQFVDVRIRLDDYLWLVQNGAIFVREEIVLPEESFDEEDDGSDTDTVVVTPSQSPLPSPRAFVSGDLSVFTGGWRA